MAQVTKNDVNNIFANDAPEQDKPASFNNYNQGWATARANNGKPTIKQFNYIQQRTDQNILWIHQNGGALPYDSAIDYVDGAIVLKDGRITKLVSGSWVDVLKAENAEALPQYYDSSTTYQVGSRICLDDNSGFVVSATENNTSNPNTNLNGWELQNTVLSVSALTEAIHHANKTAYVRGDGTYVSDGTTWNKDEPYNLYDFKTQQPIQFYYDKLGNWDDAIFQAQLNVYLKGFSPIFSLPNGYIDLKKPIKFSTALGFAIHDYLKANGIEDNFYDATTDKFKATWHSTLKGSIVYGTVLNWVGTTDATDKTYRDWALIHCGDVPTMRDYVKDGDKNLWNDRLRMDNIQLFGNGMCLHAIYIAKQSAISFFNVGVADFWGSGLFLDRTYDSTFQKLTILKCGRMVGDTKDYGYNNNLDVSKQLYAPIHVTKSSGDNCNYIRFRDCHTELNFNVVADIMVTGNSSPIWFEKHHYECGQWAGGYGEKALKSVFKIGASTGVKYFAQELDSDYDATNPTLSDGGGYVVATEIAGTTDGYAYGAITGKYSRLDLHNSTVPNAFKKIVLKGGNTSTSLLATNSTLEAIEDKDGNASDNPIVLSNVTVQKDIDLMYRTHVEANNVKIGGKLKGSILANSNPFKFSNVSVGVLDIQSQITVYGNIQLTSTTDSSAILLSPDSKLSIDNYAYANAQFI